MDNITRLITDDKLLALLNEGWIEVDDPEYGRRLNALLAAEYNNDY